MKKKGQIWVETVTYTLVAFVLIGLILSFANPKIEELQDQTIIQQSIQMLKDIDGVVREVESQGVGNKRRLEVNIREGEFEINPINETLVFRMKGKYMYSQPGQKYYEGSLKILTEEEGRDYHITVEKNYSKYNITYMNKEEIKKITRGTTPYILFISNKGGADNKIDFEII